MTMAGRGAAIDCYSAGTTNGRRVLIMLEETALPYYPIWIDLTRAEQRAAEFLAVNPAGAVPVIVDHNATTGGVLTMTQSAAILIYLAEKSGRFLPQGSAKHGVLQWLMFGISDVACATASAFQLSFIKGETGACRAHFTSRVERCLSVAENQLAGRDYLAGAFSVADICLYPNTIIPPTMEVLNQSDRFPKLRQWQARMSQRDAVARAIDMCHPPGSMPKAPV